MIVLVFLYSQKKLLLEKHVFSSKKNRGKQSLRVYLPWDKPTSKQAIRTQMWKSDYFVKFDNRCFVQGMVPAGCVITPLVTQF